MVSAGCVMGPNYKRPVVETPTTFRGAAESAGNASFADLKWFEVFRDETLTGLVNTALQQNFEIRIAAERVLQARAAYGIRRADRWPSVDASAGVTAARASERGANRGLPAGADTGVTYTEAGFSVGWELDVWGRVRRLNEAARAQYLATREARHAVVTTLVADVSETYLLLRALDLELDIARRTRDVATDSLRLTETRRTGGIASGLDVRQAEQLLFTATGRIASLEHGTGVDVSKLPELAAALDCTVTYLLGLTDDPTRWEPDSALNWRRRPKTEPTPERSPPGMHGSSSSAAAAPAATSDGHGWILGPYVPERGRRRAP